MGFMTTEPWDMPLLNWEPEGSFEAPIEPPLLGPTGGILVCIPPINKDWIKIILGCLDQLRIPATWDAVDRADLLQALNWMQELKDVVASAGPCCDVAMRLTADCGLQFSTDSGTTWQDVTGWSTYIQQCVQGWVVQPVPPFPPIPLPNQHACNIAGFLATDIIKVSMGKMVSYVGTTAQQVAFGKDVLATIGFAFPITYAAYTAFTDWYNNIVGQILSQVNFVSTDPVFWSLVTCAIYNAIKNKGYVDGSNFSAVDTNLCAISYTYPWAVAAVCQWWTDIGLQNVQSLQHEGAFDDVDCSGCGTWCEEYDFRTNTFGWAVYPGVTGIVWTPGQGFVSTPGNAGGSVTRSNIYVGTGSITGHWVKVRCAFTGPALSTDFTINAYTGGLGGTFVGSWNIGTPTGTGVVTTYICSGCADLTFDTLYFFLETNTNTGITIESIQIGGTGPNPFGVDNCTY